MDKYKVLFEHKDKIISADNLHTGTELLNIALALTTDVTERQLLMSLINDTTYNTKMNFDKLNIYFNVLDIIYYYNDAEKILEDILRHTQDLAQINTLNKIIKNKPMKQQDKAVNVIMLSKLCPHCNQKTYGSDSCSYIICGYNNRGFDWKGCGRDWCFTCGKKLCKSWNVNSLFNKMNRQHNSKCCKSYASKMQFKYPDDFCMCQSNEMMIRA